MLLYQSVPDLYLIGSNQNQQQITPQNDEIQISMNLKQFLQEVSPFELCTKKKTKLMTFHSKKSQMLPQKPIESMHGISYLLTFTIKNQPIHVGNP